eukprot:13331364-Ditylum_brightwellii.AAC.1
MIVSKWYVGHGCIKSNTIYFLVPKGDSSIKVVYYAIKRKLNQAPWAPNFRLPAVDTVERLTHMKSWFGDSDIREMFHNYFLDARLRPSAGIHIIILDDKTKTKKQQKSVGVDLLWALDLHPKIVQNPFYG